MRISDWRSDVCSSDLLSPQQMNGLHEAGYADHGIAARNRADLIDYGRQFDRIIAGLGAAPDLLRCAGYVIAEEALVFLRIGRDYMRYAIHQPGSKKFGRNPTHHSPRTAE